MEIGGGQFKMFVFISLRKETLSGRIFSGRGDNPSHCMKESAPISPFLMTKSN